MSNLQNIPETLAKDTPSNEFVENWRHSFVTPLLITALAIGLFLLIPAFVSTTSIPTKVFYSSIYLLLVGMTLFPFSYNTRITVVVFSVFALGLNELFSYGILGDGLVFFYGTIVIATMMFSPRAGVIATAVSILTFAVTGSLFLTSTLKPTSTSIGTMNIGDWFSAAATIIVFGAIIIIGFQRLQTEIDEGQRKTKAAVEALEGERAKLDERVKDRTFDLDVAAKASERRARQFEAISQVVKAVSTIQDSNLLLSRITQLLSEQFKFYHTGIFLLDDNREYAVLRASNSEGGRKMLARGHKLQVGQTGLVGMVTATGRARVAQDVGADAVYFNNPDLPETRSEITLPLRHAGQIIGALDVQSTEMNAFDQEDVSVLNTLADQVAVTLNNTLILEEARKSLAESQTTFSELTRETWKVMRPKSAGLGFQSVDSKVVPLERPLEGDYIKAALSKDKTALTNQENDSSNLAIPIRLRGQIIGVISLQARKKRKISRDETEITQAVADRLSLAIETAVLLQSTQHRADIERVTTDISSKISSSTRLEAILQTAAQELSRALGGSDVLVQIEPTSIELGMAG
ncbi:MAG: GAF domain-containing protein [Chloroflexi bacterium]|nr:GAF domain-containing protein [Chloroflexota bacterium]